MTKSFACSDAGVDCNWSVDANTEEELFLIIKYGGSPACVTPETAEKLMERGWAIS